MFVALPSGLDFWWIKPTKAKTELDQEYLTYAEKGKTKNAAGMSKPFFQGIVDLIAKQDCGNGYRWTVQPIDGTPRCVIEDQTRGPIQFQPRFFARIENFFKHRRASR